MSGVVSYIFLYAAFCGLAITLYFGLRAVKLI